MIRTTLRLGLFIVLALLLPAPACGAADATAADALDKVETQLDRVVDLFENGSDELGSATLDTAIGTLEAFTKKHPKDARAQFLLGRAYSYRGDDAEADAAYARAAELAPDKAEYQFMYGSTLARADKTAEALAAYTRAAELDPKDARSAMMVGVMHVQKGDDDDALEWLGKATKIDPKFASAHGNIGQIHQNRGDTKQALAAFEKAVEAAPQDWRYRSKLVQLYHALGRVEDRDRERAVIVDLWQEDEVDQPLFCREQFEVAGKKVQAYEYFELKGERPLRYSFVVMKPDGREADHRITLGSYDLTTRIAREQGEVGEGERMFHLDGYYPDGSHRTFGMFKREPTYDETRLRVAEVLTGKLKAASSSKPGKVGAIDVEVEAGEGE